MHSIAQFCSRGARTTIALWAGVSLLLNLVWEVAQLPLYTLPSAQSAAQIIYAVAHCLAGDVMIAATIFAGTAWLIGDLDWPISRPWRGGAAVTLFGVAYTACSEWYNVYQIGSWVTPQACRSSTGSALHRYCSGYSFPSARC